LLPGDRVVVRDGQAFPLVHSVSGRFQLTRRGSASDTVTILGVDTEVDESVLGDGLTLSNIAADVRIFHVVDSTGPTNPDLS
jgi:hypothetical protein